MNRQVAILGLHFNCGCHEDSPVEVVECEWESGHVPNAPAQNLGPLAGRRECFGCRRFLRADGPEDGGCRALDDFKTFCQKCRIARVHLDVVA